MPSRESPGSAFRWLLAKEVRELVASRSYWLLLLVVGALVGHAFITSVDLYAEASGIGGGPAALSQGLSPLEGIVVPTLGAYDLAATLLFPFVVIRLFAVEKQTGELALTLQAPARFSTSMLAKAVALSLAWIVAGLAGAVGARHLARHGRTSRRGRGRDRRTRPSVAWAAHDRHRGGGGRIGRERGERRDHRAHHHAGDVGAGLRRGRARRRDCRRSRSTHRRRRCGYSSTASCGSRRCSSC